MRILAIESSALSAGAALAEDGKLLGEFFLNVGLTHSTTLMPMIDALLRYADVHIEDVDLFAVSNGPGSFTGVRIGVSTVKGMAMAADKPCIGVSTLESTAYNLAGYSGIVCCAMDARCGQVYTALFRFAGAKAERLLPDSAMAITDLETILRAYQEPICFVGDGAALCYDAMRLSLPQAELAGAHLRYPRASGVAEAVRQGDLAQAACSAAQLSVSYLRLSQAERERKQREENGT